MEMCACVALFWVILFLEDVCCSNVWRLPPPPLPSVSEGGETELLFYCKCIELFFEAAFQKTDFHVADFCTLMKLLLCLCVLINGGAVCGKTELLPYVRKLRLTFVVSVVVLFPKCPTKPCVVVVMGLLCIGWRCNGVDLDMPGRAVGFWCQMKKKKRKLPALTVFMSHLRDYQ